MTIFPALKWERTKQKETVRSKIGRQKMNKKNDKQKIVCLVQRTGDNLHSHRSAELRCISIWYHCSFTEKRRSLRTFYKAWLHVVCRIKPSIPCVSTDRPYCLRSGARVPVCFVPKRKGFAHFYTIKYQDQLQTFSLSFFLCYLVLFIVFISLSLWLSLQSKSKFLCT